MPQPPRGVLPENRLLERLTAFIPIARLSAILRLDDGFASRSRPSAQDDRYRSVTPATRAAMAAIRAAASGCDIFRAA